MQVQERPLAGVRVVDLTVDRGELCARLLADLGCEVIKVEPAGGSPARRLPPLHGSTSLSWAMRNAGKKGVTLDLPAQQEALHGLLAASDVLVASAGLGECPIDLAATAARHRHLVVTAISPYGLTGPWTNRVATEAVVAATGGISWKTGLPDREPLTPPGSFVDDSTSVTFTFASLCALLQREQHGHGQLLDCSQNEAIAGMADWGLPNAVARKNAGDTSPMIRAGAGPLWPSLRCADGFVRIVILATRQWHAMRAWLGEPEFLQSPEWDTVYGRLSISDAVINPLIEQLFAGMTMGEIAEEAQRRGVVCTPLSMPPDVLRNEHFRARGSLVELPLGPGVEAPIPSGFLEVGGERLGPAGGPPAVGEHNALLAEPLVPRPQPGGAIERTLPLAGLRVADFGHGGVGVEVGRMLAEYGADVIKIETRTHPDFIRVVIGGEMSPSFASSNRTKRSFGVDVRTKAGYETIRRLLATCDILVENSGTGVMESSRLGYEELVTSHPGLVMVSSQLMGAHGPWARFRGYGPSTRAASGLEMLWNYADTEAPAGGSSIFPDHLAGRVGALGALAALFQRGRNGGRGAHIDVAQVEVALGIVGELLTKEALEPGSVKATGNRRDRGTPWGLFRCQGNDRWVAITCRHDADWAALVGAMGSPAWASDPALATAAAREARIDEIEQGVSAWTAGLEREDVVARCQAAGVPAGEMLTPLDQLECEQYRARGALVPIEQHGVAGGATVLEGPGFFGEGIGDVLISEAPRLGEHTKQICVELLGMDPSEVDALIASGALETTPVE